MPTPDSTAAIDPGACERCNCHHHSTEDHDMRKYVSDLWAEDWDSEEDAVYDAAT